MEDKNHAGFVTWMSLVDPRQYDYYNSSFKFPGNVQRDFPGQHQVDVISNLQKLLCSKPYPTVNLLRTGCAVATHQSWQSPYSWRPSDEHCPLHKSNGFVGCHPVPAHRHANLFPELKAQRFPSYNESDETPKLRPSFLKDFPTFNEAQAEAADLFYRDRIRTLLSVDEMVESLF